MTCVILASDAEPLVLIAPIVKLCEEHSIPYCFIQDQACLGWACGISWPVICAAF